MQVTITTSSAAYNTTAITNAIDLDRDYGLGPCGPTECDTQVAYVTAWGSSATGSATLRMVLADNSQIYAYKDLTITPTSLRTGLDGASGSYICTVSVSDSSDAKFDLLGATKDRHWKLYSPSTWTTLTSITLDFSPTNVI